MLLQAPPSSHRECVDAVSPRLAFARPLPFEHCGLQLNQTNFEPSHQLSVAQQELANKAKEIDHSESRRKFAEDRLRKMRLRDEHVGQ